MKVPVAVAGCGTFGRHHARVYRNLAGAELVGVFDTRPEQARSVAAEFGTRAFDTLDELKRSARAASLAVPTAMHAPIGKELMAAGLDVLVEKPIAATLSEADDLIATAERTGRILQVGHLERFNPSVRLVRPRVTQPLFFEVHRLSMFTPRSLDVDVLLDLMIHDLDIVLDFVNAPIREVRAVGLPVLTPRVDIANVRMSFANGCVANFTASRVSTEKVRKLRFFQPQEYISLDYTRQDAHLYRLDSAQGAPRIGHQHLTAPQEEPLTAELSSFVECVRERKPPLVGGPAARNALAAALLSAGAIAEHAAEIGLARS